MSGGTFEYLYSKEADDLVASRDEILELMADTLEALGHTAAANETRELLAIVRQYRERATRAIGELTDVWKAVEYYHANDWGRDDVHIAIEAWRARRTEDTSA